MSGQGRRGRGLRLSGLIVALALGAAVLVLALAASTPRVPHAAGSLLAAAEPPAQAINAGSAASLSAPFTRSIASSSSNPYRVGVIVLGFRPGVSTGRQHAIERAAGGQGARRLGPAIKPVGHGRVSTQEFISPFALRVPASQELAVAARLRHDPAVAYAEPNYLQQGTATATPTDPSFALQWGAYNTGQAIRSQNGNEELGAWEGG